MVRALLHVTQAGIPGLYNVAAEGRLPWSEVANDLRDPACAPFSVQPLKIRPLARLFDLPAELQDLLRYGRGVDTRRFAGTGFTLQRHQRRRGADLHPGPAPTPADRQAAARRTPTSTTWSSSSVTHPPSWVAATPDDQASSHSCTSSRSRTAHSSAVMP